MSAVNLKDKVAIITGGNSGIGKAITEVFYKAGAHTVIVARNRQKSDQVIEELSALGQNNLAVSIVHNLCDHSKHEEIINKIFLRFGRIDILVNNAGITIRKLPQNLTFTEWQQVIDTNLSSAFLLSQHCYKHLKNNPEGGKIINIGSMTSLFGVDIAVAYAASKGGLVQMTKSLCSAWAKENICVNAILPGWIETELTEKGKQEHPEFYSNITRRIPAKKWGNPIDIAYTALWLCNKYSNYINGVAISVDGGFSSNIN